MDSYANQRDNIYDFCVTKETFPFSVVILVVIFKSLVDCAHSCKEPHYLLKDYTQWAMTPSLCLITTKSGLNNILNANLFSTAYK